MRTSEAERERVADFLRDCCAEGRLHEDELEERLQRLFTGQTVADLELLIWDLPGGARVVPTGPPAVTAPAAAPDGRDRRVARRPIGALVVFVAAIAVLWSMPPEAIVGVTVVALVFIVFALVLATVLAPAGFVLLALAWLAGRLWRGLMRPPVR
jgi:hypothetical protein